MDESTAKIRMRWRGINGGKKRKGQLMKRKKKKKENKNKNKKNKNKMRKKKERKLTRERWGREEGSEQLSFL